MKMKKKITMVMISLICAVSLFAAPVNGAQSSVSERAKTMFPNLEENEDGTYTSPVSQEEAEALIDKLDSYELSYDADGNRIAPLTDEEMDNLRTYYRISQYNEFVLNADSEQTNGPQNQGAMSQRGAQGNMQNQTSQMGAQNQGAMSQRGPQGQMQNQNSQMGPQNQGPMSQRGPQGQMNQCPQMGPQNQGGMPQRGPQGQMQNQDPMGRPFFGQQNNDCPLN